MIGKTLFFFHYKSTVIAIEYLYIIRHVTAFFSDLICTTRTETRLHPIHENPRTSGLIYHLLGTHFERCGTATAFESTHTTSPTVLPILLESMPYKSLVALDRSRQIADCQMLVIRMSDQDRAGTI